MGRQFARQKTLTINSVSVGPTNTDAQKNARGKLLEAYIDAMKEYATAEKRLGKPEEIASVVAFMAEDGSRWINGDTICVTGGAAMW